MEFNAKSDHPPEEQKGEREAIALLRLVVLPQLRKKRDEPQGQRNHSNDKTDQLELGVDAVGEYLKRIEGDKLVLNKVIGFQNHTLKTGAAWDGKMKTQTHIFNPRNSIRAVLVLGAEVRPDKTALFHLKVKKKFREQNTF